MGSIKPLIELRNISKSYLKKKPLFSDVNFRIHAGEFLFLSGVSGAGKSTVFKLLMGLEKPDVGEVFFNGVEVSSIPKKQIPDHRRRIGIVFQDYKLLNRKSAEENIAIPLRILGLSSTVIEKRIEKIAARLNIERLLEHSIESLSGGEQQLIAIARASIHNPPLILADEPTANLDQKTADRIVNLLSSLNEDGITIIIATHDINLIKSSRKRVLLIKKTGIIEVH